jgi:ubiquinol-cytochrome c reductase cytochrome c1 subunit
MVHPKFPSLLRAAGIALAFALAGGAGAVTEEAPGAEHANVDVSNVASLQRGARNFVNYCMGCHSAQYVRYNRLGIDLQVSERQLIENLMFAAEKPQETMTIAMRGEDAARWFGVTPPDLSLIARNRGADYVYNFLRGFYVDASRPTGVNNLMLPGTAMPHVLWELQGVQDAVYVEEQGPDGVSQKKIESLRLAAPGSLTPEEYDHFVRDTVNFLAYVGEPMQLERQRLGFWVLGYLLVFGILAYLLKQEIWKDVK